MLETIERIDSFTIGIYQIINKHSKKCYIGKSVDVKNRLKQHYRELTKGEHCNVFLQKDFDKYGESAFVVSLLKECKEDELSKYESHYCHENDIWNKGYNIAKLKNVTNVKTKDIQAKEKFIETINGYERLCSLVKEKGEIRVASKALAEKINYPELELKRILRNLNDDDLTRLPFVFEMEHRSFSGSVIVFRTFEKDEELQEKMAAYLELALS